MDDRTARLIRDGSLALVALGALLDALRRRERLDALFDPAAALSGVVGSLGIEVFLLRHPERTRDLWERPGVQAAGSVGTVVIGRALARDRGERAAAALCWGLLAYLVLLAVVRFGRRSHVSSFGRTVENGPDQS